MSDTRCKPVDDARNRSLMAALSSLAGGRADATADLYDMIGPSVYQLAFMITDERASAERATVETFVRVGETAAWVPREASDARRWILDVACCVAREVATRPVRPLAG